MKSIYSFVEKLISIKSVSDNSKALEEALELVLFELKEYTIERFESNGIKSALVYSSKKRPKKFKVILNGHLDVIPGKNHQYTSKIKGNKLYGAGSMDMKASVACLVSVFKDTAKRLLYPIGLQLVTDEEIGGFYGTKYQFQKGVRADFVIAAEPTNFNIVNKSKGILWLKVFAQGKTAHSAYPWSGTNAILLINEFINRVNKKYPIVKSDSWKTTVNLSMIESEHRVFNKIADKCFVGIDIRYVPQDAQSILKNIKKLLPKDCSLEVMEKEPACFTNPKDKYILLLQKSVKGVLDKNSIMRGANGSSDLRHFNCPGVEFGPVGGGIGSDEEWVDISSLEKYCQILSSFLSSIGEIN